MTGYLEKRGNDIWTHRGIADGYIPGSVRYEVLKRAEYRCELCGAHEDQAALHVDHILPKARGGSDEINNFQALCVTCNTNKRDRDDTDFRDVLASYHDRSAGCIFCEIRPERVVAENELCYVIRDRFPVTPLHTLVIPKRHVADYFDLYQPKLNAIHSMLNEQRADILRQDQTATGFNIGMNVPCGPSSVLLAFQQDRGSVATQFRMCPYKSVSDNVDYVMALRIDASKRCVST